MATTSDESVWTTRPPAHWPEPPPLMTVSTLAQIEACPRSWALNAAHYPCLWQGRGYPLRPHVRAVEGTVVHSAVARITKELVRGRCPSLHDPVAVEVLKHLGGYTAIVTECVKEAVQQLAKSPRTKHLQVFIATSLCAKLPELRTRVQTLLSRARLPPFNVHDIKDHTLLRSALAAGAFPEIELRATQIGWKGRADLLVISPEGCDITDFKTGAPNSGHGFQMEVYGMLWCLDTDLNPDARPVKRLILAYSAQDVDVTPLTGSDLENFKLKLIERKEAALQAACENPPEARPSADNCLHCTVRQLCNEYWTVATQQKIRADSPNLPFVDIEVEMIARHGPKSWDAVIVCSAVADQGRSILVRYEDVPFEFQANQRVRLLSVNITIPNERTEFEQNPVVASMSALSEVFVVSDS